MELLEDSINNLEKFSLGRKIWKGRMSEVCEGTYGPGMTRELLFKSLRTVPVEERSSEDSRLKRLVTTLPPSYQFLNPHYAGVTRDGYSLLVCSPFDSKPLDYKSLSYLEGLGLFIQCLKSLEKFDSTNLIFQDICLDVFRTIPSGEVLFFGFLNNVKSQTGTSDLPNDASRIFYSPEEIIGGESSVYSTIFALGVLGYILVTGSEVSNLSPTGINNFLKENTAPSISREGIPDWLDVVLGSCLKVSPEQRIPSVSQLLFYLEEGIKNDKSSLGSVKWSSRDVAVANDKAVVKATASTMVKGRVIEGPKIDDVRKKSKKFTPFKFSFTLPKLLVYFVWTTTAFLGIGLSIFVFSSLKFISFSAGHLSKVLEEIQEIDSSHALDRHLRILDDHNEHITARLEALNGILGANVESDKLLIKYCREDKLANDFQKPIKQKFFEHVKSLGYEATYKYLESFFDENPTYFCLLGDLVFDTLNPMNSDSNRIKALRMLVANNLEQGIILTGFLSVESTETLFLVELRRFLTGKGFEVIPDTFDLKQLSLLDSELDKVTGKSTEEVLANLDEASMKNVLMLILRSRSANVQSLPRLLEMYKAKLNLGNRSIKLFEIAQSIESSNIYMSHLLILSAMQMLGEADTKAFVDWSDSRFEDILYLMIGVGQADNVTVPLVDILSSRGIRNPRAKILLSWLKEAFWSSRAKYAPPLITLSVRESASDEELDKAFLDLMPISQHDLFGALVKIGEPYFTSQAISRMGQLTDTKILLPLLRDPDKEIRIATIQALFGRNDLQTLQYVLRAFRSEKDEEVKDVYKKNHWVTLERDLPQNLKN